MPVSMTRRRALAGLGALLASPVGAQDAGKAFDGFPATRVWFASVEQGRSLLMAQDQWMAATSDFQRQAVMRSAAGVTLEQFQRWNGDAVRPWREAQLVRWRKALQTLAPAFQALRIALPSDVWLVSSNGQESADAPYTRGRAVVLPVTASFATYSDAMLLAHELWHVASRHAPELATRLYAELGFEPIAPLVFPSAWAGARIANPDAPDNRHAMRLRIDGREALVTPVLVAARTRLAPGESFFDVMQTRLLEVAHDPASGVSRAVLRQGQPVWHALDGAHDYLRRLGGNTGYVIHVEEALADNVALLATGAAVRNTALLGRLRQVLLQARGTRQASAAPPSNY